MDRNDLEEVRRSLLKPDLRRVTVKTPFAFYMMNDGCPYRIVSQDGEYCTFQELTSEEVVQFVKDMKTRAYIWQE